MGDRRRSQPRTCSPPKGVAVVVLIDRSESMRGQMLEQRRHGMLITTDNLGAIPRLFYGTDCQGVGCGTIVR